MEEKHSRLIVVPWDFTHVAENALLHALKIATNLDKEITLLHILKKGTADEQKKKLEGILQDKASEVHGKYGIKPEIVFQEGSIFTTISEYVNEMTANMVVMGTHGMKGMQKIVGSWALKVIIGSKSPFIVVQDPPKDMDKITDIVFPVDFKNENKEKLFWTINLGRYFNSKVHLFKIPVTDNSLNKRININLNFAIRFLIQNKLEYVIQESKKGGSKFAMETIKYAEQMNAGLIAIMTTKHIHFGDYLLGAHEQFIIANSAKIPVMCVNPMATFSGVGQFMFGSG